MGRHLHASTRHTDPGHVPGSRRDAGRRSPPPFPPAPRSGPAMIPNGWRILRQTVPRTVPLRESPHPIRHPLSGKASSTSPRHPNRPSTSLAIYLTSKAPTYQESASSRFSKKSLAKRTGNLFSAFEEFTHESVRKRLSPAQIRRKCAGSGPPPFFRNFSFQHFSFSPPPIFLPALQSGGPATGFSNDPHPKSKFLAVSNSYLSSQCDTT